MLWLPALPACRHRWAKWQRDPTAQFSSPVLLVRNPLSQIQNQLWFFRRLFHSGNKCFTGVYSIYFGPCKLTSPSLDSLPPKAPLTYSSKYRSNTAYGEVFEGFCFWRYPWGMWPECHWAPSSNSRQHIRLQTTQKHGPCLLFICFFFHFRPRNIKHERLMEQMWRRTQETDRLKRQPLAAAVLPSPCKLFRHLAHGQNLLPWNSSLLQNKNPWGFKSPLS